MPANEKYLSSTSQRIAKISAGIIGGYFAAIALHLVWGVLSEDKAVMVLTSAFSTFFLWVGFMILAFLAKNGWIYWLKMLAIIVSCGLIIYFLK